jgi:hypothetical protein
MTVTSALIGVEVVADIYWSNPGTKIHSYLPTVRHLYHLCTCDVQPHYHAGRDKFGTHTYESAKSSL